MTCGVGQPASAVREAHLVRSKNRRSGLAENSPRPQMFPNESVGYISCKESSTLCWITFGRFLACSSQVSLLYIVLKWVTK